MKDIDRRTFLKELAAGCALLGLPACSNIRPDTSHGLTPSNTPSAPSELPITQFESTGKIKRDVIIIAMPGGMSFVGSLLVSLTASSFESVTQNVKIIGDGQHSITLDEINAGLTEAMASSKANGHDVTGIFLGRGEQINGNVGIVSDYDSDFHPSGEDIIPYEHLVRSFVKAGKGLSEKQDVGLFFVTCYGNAALWYASLLPKNFSIAANTHQNGPTDMWDQIKLFQGMNNNPVLAGDLSPKALMKAYLAKAGNYDNPPLLYVSGKGYFDPYSTIKNRLGNPFSPKEEVEIHSALSPNFNTDIINDTIKVISAAKNMSDLDDVFGPAMSIGLELSTASSVYPEQAFGFRHPVTNFALNNLKVHDGIQIRKPHDWKAGETTPISPSPTNFWPNSSTTSHQCGM